MQSFDPPLTLIFLFLQIYWHAVIMVKMGRIFRAHGEFCASHPWEVIVALITFTACMFSVDKGSMLNNDPLIPSKPSVKPLCHGWRQSCDGFEAQYIAADVILMVIVRVSGVLYCYYQFCNLHKLGSKYILGKLNFILFNVRQALEFIFSTETKKIIKIFSEHCCRRELEMKEFVWDALLLKMILGKHVFKLVKSYVMGYSNSKYPQFPLILMTTSLINEF